MPILRLLLLSGLLAGAHAQTTLHLYRGGENDGGAVNGGSLAPLTPDSGGATTLLRQNSAGTYTSATFGAGSTLAYNFNGTGVFSGAVDSTLTGSTSFVMEVWFNTTTLTGASALFYNGDTGGNGVGLFRADDHLAILGGGVIFDVGTTTLATNTWYHAALMNDSNLGQLTLYLNGVAEFSRANDFNAPVSGGLAIGGNAGLGDLYNGALDEARVFTFAPGSFSPSMLAYSAVPEPSTYAAILGVGAAGMVAWRRRRRTQLS
jgi:hypothetical protein